MLSVEMLCACSVLQDCADQLAVMGNIIGANTRLEKEIAYLKDQLDTIGVKSNRQRKFVKSCAEQLVCQEQNLNRHKEKDLEDEVTDLQKKLQYWKQRYEKDMNTKKQEITELQTKRNVIQERIQELSMKCKHMEEVIIEDRMTKERLRAQLEKEQREGDAATRIQAWWRGILVRRGLRSPKKADKSKSKAGKKAKKGKKKK
ncbi:IQ domain-containing G [Labeo rohita]|uniref:Dynein regulatory complex protein 9 n=1 Tax=Labeo rohita TaxID=84645 RepID=A0A498N964_LABRO|nr:IQ domain-containing G [Labeo rohita]